MSNVKDPFTDTFLPYNYKNHEVEYDEQYKFNVLTNVSKEYSKIGDIQCEQMGDSSHVAYYQSLDESGLNRLSDITSRNPSLDFNNEVLSMIDSILTEDIDRELKSYLGSNYAVMFYSVRELTPESRETNPSCRWHCDSAPKNSAMLMCYLEDNDEHDSSTLLLDEKTTFELKKLGYVYCAVRNRREHIDDLLDYFQLDNNIRRHSFKAGESILFGAANIAHRAEVPKPGATRRTFDLCIIPSPVPWKDAIKNGYTPYNVPAGYKGQVERLLSTVNLLDAVNDKKEINHSVVQIPATGGIINKESLKFHLESIFKDKVYAHKLYEQIITMTVNFSTLTINELLAFLKKSFKDGLNWEGDFKQADLANLSDLVEYEKTFQESVLRFTLAGKPVPEAIMWPIPDHEKHPRSKFDMLPFVKGAKIMDKSTAIGSAGSCFAVEIAEVLQEEGFNYVITELGDNPGEEAIIDGYEVGTGKAMYSANFGILFNTPSLKQIAEKAFGEREFTKYFVQSQNSLYMDPYRENVYFASKENYLRDYPKHVEAIRQTLLQSEVFIFTAGLNECWQLKDGTAISRNPRNGLFHLMEHKVLTVEENVNNIMTFFNIVKRHNPKFKLILTLSPVPLLATGRGDTHHILEANTHSKAVLRVALEEVVKMHEDIYYLPSYELVTECVPNPWKADHRHVTPETVSKVISMFKQMYVAD